MTKFRISLWVGFLTLLVPFAASAFEITAVGGLNYAAPTQRTSGIDIHQTGNATGTFGLLLATPLWSSGFDLETGVVDLVQQSERDDVLPSRTQKMQFLQVPVVLRYRLDESISLGAGFYAAFAQGNVEMNQNGIETQLPYESLGYQKTDTGLILNLRARFAMAPPLYLILDARYQHGLSNLAQYTNDVLNTRSIQAMAGLTYEFDSGSSASDSRPQRNTFTVPIPDSEE